MACRHTGGIEITVREMVAYDGTFDADTATLTIRNDTHNYFDAEVVSVICDQCKEEVPYHEEEWT